MSDQMEPPALSEIPLPPELPLSTSEYLRSLELGDETCSIVLAIVSVNNVKKISHSKGPFDVGSAKGMSQDGEFFQVCSWRDNASLIPNTLKPGRIYAFDFCEKKTAQLFGDLRSGFEFSVFPSSEVTNLREIPKEAEEAQKVNIALLEPGKLQSFEAYALRSPVLVKNQYLIPVVEDSYKVRVRLPTTSEPIVQNSKYLFIGHYLRGTFDCKQYHSVEGRLPENDPRIYNTKSPSKRKAD